MERRHFLKTSGLFAGLPIVSIFQGSIAQAQTNENNWKLLFEAPFGKVQFQVLWTDSPGLLPDDIKDLNKEVLGASAILYRFSPDFPQRGHWHPKGEYIYALQGSGTNGDKTLSAGNDSYMPPGSYHPPGKIGPDGMDAFVFTPAPVDFKSPAPETKLSPEFDDTTG